MIIKKYINGRPLSPNPSKTTSKPVSKPVPQPKTSPPPDLTPRPTLQPPQPKKSGCGCGKK